MTKICGRVSTSMMGQLADLPLDDLLELAKNVGALDEWQTTDGVFVFESSTMRIAVESQKAKPFVRGLLRGYELALELQERSNQDCSANESKSR